VVGYMTGYLAQDISYTVAIGYAAARYLQENHRSVILGYAAGEYAHRSGTSIMLGHHAGYRASDSAASVMIGRFAGAYADRTPSCVFIGPEAGAVEKRDEDTHIPSANDIIRGVYIGARAGADSSDTVDVVLIGTDTAAAPGIQNAVGIGRRAQPAQSNSWHIPDPMKVGFGVSAPTAQLHVTQTVRFEAMPNGVLVTDALGNVSASDALAQALQQIAELRARIEALEAT
jgi:hypothetical protein